MKNYVLTMLIILILRTLDLVLTYLYSPDLRAEFNPAVSCWGFSWPEFIGIQLLVLAIIALSGFQYFRLSPVLIRGKNLNFTDFIYYYFNGKLEKWPQRIKTFPKTFKPLLIFNGFILISTALLVSLFAIINNLILLSGNDTYSCFLAGHFNHFIPMMFVCIILASFFIFFGKEYSNYKQRIKSGKH